MIFDVAAVSGSSVPSPCETALKASPVMIITISQDNVSVRPRSCRRLRAHSAVSDRKASEPWRLDGKQGAVGVNAANKNPDVSRRLFLKIKSVPSSGKIKEKQQ